MKATRVITGVSLVLALALLTACTTIPPRTVRTVPARTYAVVVTDGQGTLSQADFQKVQIGVIQYLTDEGLVQPGDHFTSDLLHADVVFRVRIAWQGTAGGFAVTEVAPSYGGGQGAPAYATEPGVAESPWWNDPWYDGDYYGSYDGYFDPFWGFYPFAGIYAWDHYRSPRAIKRPPEVHDHDGHRPTPPRGYTRYSPRPSDRDGWAGRWPADRAHRPENDNDNRHGDRRDWRDRHPDRGHTPVPGAIPRNSSTPAAGSRWQPGHQGSGDHLTPRSSPPRQYSAPPRQYSAPPAAMRSSSPSYSAPVHSAPAPSYSAPVQSSPAPAASSSSRDGGSQPQQKDR